MLIINILLYGAAGYFLFYLPWKIDQNSKAQKRQQAKKEIQKHIDYRDVYKF